MAGKLRPLAVLLGVGSALFAYAARRWWRGRYRPAEEDDRGTVVSYVPDEVCIAVSAGQIRDPQGFYTAVADALNRSLAELIGGGTVEQGDPYRQDLAPQTLRRYYGTPSAGATDQAPLLQGLARRGDAVSPYILLPATGEGRTRALHFYHVRSGTPPDDLPAQLASTRELVLLVNASLDKVNRDLLRSLRQLPAAPAQEARIDGATPNWLAAGAPIDHTEGGPGAAPVPVGRGQVPQRGRFTYRFTSAGGSAGPLPPLHELVEEQRERARAGEQSGILVAVLDTCPPRERVAKATDAYPDNTLLQDVQAHVSIDEPPSLPAGSAYFTHLAGTGSQPLVPNWQEALARPPAGHAGFLMPDHGLFAAGIIRDIAPTAQVRLIRVLNDYGTGDLFSLTSVLSQLPDLLKESGQRRLVVNLSLVADLPPDDQLLRSWFPQTAADPATLAQRWSDVQRMLDRLHQSLQAVIDWIASQDERVLVVAAAGNDNGARPGQRPSPRWPARYDRVLGVAAVNLESRPAEYSNRGDFVVIGNGVATFGGDAHRTATGTLPRITTSGLPADQVDAVAGVFSAEEFPLGAGRNETGWAYWAGTSFAAPVVSAIAACIWASPAGAGYTPAQVIDAVRAYATAGAPELECPSIPARQEYGP